MTLIAEKDRQTVRDLLARELVEEVELLLFTRDRSHQVAPGQQPCLSCDETLELLEELASLSDKLRLALVDVHAEPDAAARYNVTATPMVIVRRHAPSPADELPGNVRFVGLPGGYEFSTLLADVVDVSKARTDLSESGRAAVRAVDRPVHIQVFVTPT